MALRIACRGPSQDVRESHCQCKQKLRQRGQFFRSEQNSAKGFKKNRHKGNWCLAAAMRSRVANFWQSADCRKLGSQEPKFVTRKRSFHFFQAVFCFSEVGVFQQSRDADFFFFLKICPTSQKLRFSTSQKQGFCFGPGISHVARQDECRDSLETLLLSRVRPIFHLLPSWLSAGGGYDQINPNGKVRDACSSVALALPPEQTFF